MNHYFSEKPEIKSEKKTIKYTIQNKKFEFITDNGVFSKSKVDFGTDLMLNEFLKRNKSLKSEKIKILDIGCGYGVVSVILKSFYPEISITLSDVNERALELSEENLKKNNINHYEIIKSSAFEKITGINQKLIHHYATGLKKPREAQRKKIEEGLHALGRELLSIEL